MKLRPTILAMRPGTRVVSHSFTMEDWEADEISTMDGRRAYFWVVPANVMGTWQLDAGSQKTELSLDQTFQKINGSVKLGAIAGRPARRAPERLQHRLRLRRPGRRAPRLHRPRHRRPDGRLVPRRQGRRGPLERNQEVAPRSMKEHAQAAAPSFRRPDRPRRPVRRGGLLASSSATLSEAPGRPRPRASATSCACGAVRTDPFRLSVELRGRASWSVAEGRATSRRERVRAAPEARLAALEGLPARSGSSSRAARVDLADTRIEPIERRTARGSPAERTASPPRAPLSLQGRLGAFAARASTPR